MLMTPASNELILIRHAPVATPGKLFGRTDVAAKLPPDDALTNLRTFLANARTRVSSPALRCRQTAAALWPDDTIAADDPSLWEQDFGDWDGRAVSDIPDIGALSGDALAAHAAPNGESFQDVCTRAAPTLRTLGSTPSGPAAAVVHAGIVRACVALAIGSPGRALCFEVEPLSVSRFLFLPDGTVIVRAVNTHL